MKKDQVFMTDKDIGQKIQQAVDGIRPDPAAKERVRRRVRTARGTAAASRLRDGRSSFRWLVPVCLFTVLTVASAGILGRELLTDRGETQPTKPINTEIATEVIYIDVNERVTVNGGVYRRATPDVAAGEKIGSVEFATDSALAGLPVFATTAQDTVAVQPEGGETRFYEYFGVSDGSGGVIDDGLGDYFDVRGIDTESVSSIRLRDPGRDVEERNGEAISYAPHRCTITDKAIIRQTLGIFSSLQRDMAGYEAAQQTEKPYEGWLGVTLVFDTEAGQRTAELHCYPKIGYMFGGYHFDDTFLGALRELIERESE